MDNNKEHCPDPDGRKATRPLERLSAVGCLAPFAFAVVKARPQQRRARDGERAGDGEDGRVDRLEELDDFEARSREIFARESNRLDPVVDADKIAQHKKRLDDNLLRFEKNRKEVAVNRASSHWAGGPPKK